MSLADHLERLRKENLAKKAAVLSGHAGGERPAQDLQRAEAKRAAEVRARPRVGRWSRLVQGVRNFRC